MSSTKQSALDEQARIELVLDILGGGTTVAEAAAQHGLDPVEVECWKALYVDGLRHAATVGKPSWLRRVRSTARRRPIAVTGGALAALLVLLVPVTALSETPAGCTDAASMDLCLFIAGQPAVAEEVNSNFSKMLGWLEEKVGDVGSPDITTTGDVSAGQVSAASVTATDIIATGDVTADTVTTTGAVAAGQLDLGGSINSSDNEDGSYPLLPPDFCVVIPHGGSCPTGWGRAAIKWDTEDQNNADGRVAQVAVDQGSTGSIGIYFCCRGDGWTFTPN
jgi:hypothetical protein